MDIFGVTEYLRTVIRAAGGDPDRETLSYIKTKDGDNFFQDSRGQPWRCYNYIADSVCYQSVETPEQFYQSARSFGTFLKQLDGYPIETLHETIPKFHDTESRLRDFKKAVHRDVKNRVRSCKKEVDFVLARSADCSVLMNGLRAGELPLRVTHNDTKLNNILFDGATGKGMCIIDLDTIMPGEEGDELRYVLQRVNTHVFKNPREVMQNIFGLSWTCLRPTQRAILRRRGTCSPPRRRRPLPGRRGSSPSSAGCAF